MSYDKLKAFVEEQKNAGVAESSIREALVEKGWNNELIDKAILEVFVLKIENNPLSISDLFENTWYHFRSEWFNYLIISLITIILPLIPIIIFSAPIIYDIEVLKLNPTDFISSQMLPIMAFYVFVSVIIILIFALWGNLSMIILAANEGKMRINSALKKAWEMLTGYIWINLLNFFISIILVIPSIIIISLVATKITPETLSLPLLLSAFVLSIPAIIISIMFTFASYSYVIHGSKGWTALRNSYNLIKNNFKFVFKRLIVLWLVVVAISIVLNKIPYAGSFAKILIAPLIVIYMTKLYRTTENIGKAENIEVTN